MNQGGLPWFKPRVISRRDLRDFSTFAKVRTLRLQKWEIYYFMPNVKHYFGQLSPTLRPITLLELRCTPRQLSHSLSLFSNPDDIEIQHVFKFIPTPTDPGSELLPFSAPKLRGRLELHAFHWVGIWMYLINPCGGLQFRYVDLCRVDYAPCLLEACATTPETLTFPATDYLLGK